MAEAAELAHRGVAGGADAFFGELVRLAEVAGASGVLRSAAVLTATDADALPAFGAVIEFAACFACITDIFFARATAPNDLLEELALEANAALHQFVFRSACDAMSVLERFIGAILAY